MRTAGHRPGDRLTPALAGAVALHLGLLAILLLHPTPPLAIGAAVPITIVSHAPTTDSRRAIQAPEAQAAQTETPVPQAKAPEPPPPPPPPQPRNPQPKAVAAPEPKPTPAPTKTPLKATPTPEAKPTPAQPTPKTKTAQKSDNFSLDSLQADVSRSLKRSPPRPSFAARGPTRVETAPEARVDAGQGVSQSDVAGLSQLLQRLWNVNCGDETVVVTVSFKVGDDGHLVGPVDDHGLRHSSNPAIAVAAVRAIDAVHKVAPYDPKFRNNTFNVKFDAQKACATS
ncbi:MAG TPA: energy transducer TonB [Caulobacteraceae bacterium]|jgi:outer membrane biosynthesis protein TonB